MTNDWMPNGRQDQLEAAMGWAQYLGPRAASFNIPLAEVTNLATLAATANGALGAAMNETTRTPVATAACRTAFGALTGAMRDFRRQFIHIPPMAETDMAALGQRVRDHHPTPVGPPTAQVRADPFLTAPHELGVKIVYVSGDPDDRANKGFRIYYAVVAPGGAAITDPAQLNQSFYTKRVKDVITFDFGASGSTAYFAVQIEYDGKKGPWGPLSCALIP